MFADFFIVVLVLYAFLPLSLVMASGLRAYLLGPIVSSFAALCAAYIHILVDVPLWSVWATLVVFQLAIIVSPALRHRVLQNAHIAKNDSYSIGVLAISVISVAVATISAPAPLAWDARSIWFHHAKWLDGPAEYFIEAQFLPAGHWPDYPFGGPALMALSWQVSGSSTDLWLASRVVGALVVLVGVLTVTLIIARFGSKVSVAVKLGLVLVYPASLTLLADRFFNAGYQDALQASMVALLLASVLALKSPRWQDLFLPATAYLLAVNVKQEGFWFATIALVLGLVFQITQRQYRSLSLLFLPVSFYLTWAQFQAHVGMPSNPFTGNAISRLPRLVVLDPQVTESLEFVYANGIEIRSLPFLLLAFLSSVLLICFAIDLRALERIVLSVVLFSAALVVFGTVITTYVLGPTEVLSWWIDSSYVRITSTFELLVLLSLATTTVLVAPRTRTPT